jgi:hypothetical protein
LAEHIHEIREADIPVHRGWPGELATTLFYWAMVFEGNFRVHKRHGRECKLYHLQKLYYQGSYEMGKKEGAGRIFYLGVK